MTSNELQTSWHCCYHRHYFQDQLCQPVPGPEAGSGARSCIATDCTEHTILRSSTRLPAIYPDLLTGNPRDLLMLSWLSKINWPKKLKAIAFIRSIDFALGRCDLCHQMQLKWSMCFYWKDSLSLSLSLYIQRKQEWQRVHTSEFLFWMTVWCGNERAQNPLKEIKCSVKKYKSSPSAKILLPQTPYKQISAGGSQVCSSVLHKVTVGTPTPVAGKGSPGTSWGHRLCLGEDRWPGASLLVFHFPIISSSLSGLICTSKCECLPPAPGHLYLCTLSILFLKSKFLPHKIAMIILCSRNTYMFVSFK